MSGFAVYSSEFDPQRLYSHGDPDIDIDRVARAVRYGDQPLAFVVNFEENVLCWSFKGKRRTTSSRTGYFIAVYRGEDLFRGFAAELRRLHETDEWAIPHTGDPRWDIGFDAWRIQPKVPELSEMRFDRLADRLGGIEGDGPVEFGVRTHLSALQIVRALEERGIDCTVAIGADGDSETLTDVDLLLYPGTKTDFDPRSIRAAGFVDRSNSGSSTTDALFGESSAPGGDGSLWTRLTVAASLVALGFATISFVTPTPVRPITGLATVGGLVGSIAGFVVGQAIREGDSVSTVGGADSGSLFTGSGSSPGDPVELVRSALSADRDRLLFVVSLGTVAGFAFPRVMWEVGLLMGSDGFPFGSIATISGAVPTAVFYVVIISVLAGVLTVVNRGSGDIRLNNSLVRSFLLGFILYAGVLALSTGLAGVLWFRIIPSASV